MIVLLHGFMDSPHTWDLVRPYLPEDVLAPALPGHLGGPPRWPGNAGTNTSSSPRYGRIRSHVRGESMNPCSRTITASGRRRPWA